MQSLNHRATTAEIFNNFPYSVIPPVVILTHLCVLYKIPF